jgi:addiction module RelE/StbE family toxin
MVRKVYQLVWTETALVQIREIFEYIERDSPKSAKKIILDIISATEKAITNPEFYNPDKFKNNNDGSYRAFEKHKYRIVYRFEKNIIIVLRVRHTKIEPKIY